MQIIAKNKNSTISARIFRAKTGKWENLGVISKTKNSLIRRIIKWLQF